MTSVPAPSEHGAAPSVGQYAIEARDLAVSFQGVQALAGATFAIREGVTTGIIGPNGAGKSTAFNVVSGFVRPDHGSVLSHGQDVTWSSPRDRVRLGMARSFQELRLFESLTVRQNVLAGIPATRFSGERRRRARRRAFEGEVTRLTEFFGISNIADTPVRDLGYGDQKLVSLARVVATGCRTLLLDEPTSGLDANQLAEVMSLLHQLADDHTICIVEHNMDVIADLVEEIFVMDRGAVIVSGSPDDVLTNEQVLEVYLGQ